MLTKPNEAASACPYVPPTPSDSSDTPTTSSSLWKLNPLNYMPTLIPNSRTSETQTQSLPLEREPSTIPRGDGSGSTWEYPSPQQMYNAMLKKGYTDTPAEDVPAMVAVHNFLNEGAWDEIREWERRFAPGLSHGWRASRRGEENAAMDADISKRQFLDLNVSVVEKYKSTEPSLVKFMGRPNEPSPKARMLRFMAYMWPDKYASAPPFDRHDWTVRRASPDGQARELRYVIDYYSGPSEPTGEPVFFLDVRPAIDGPTAAAERALRWWGDVWWRAKGGSAIESARADHKTS